MKKLMIAAAATLCAAVGFSAVESSNTVGYNTHTKVDGVKYETYGCPFITPGAAGTTFKLYDMKIVGTMTASTKKQNYIQMFQTNTLKFDNAKAYFWDYNLTSAVTGEKGCWCYKFSDTTTGQTANTEVPHDVTFPAGTAFLFQCPTDSKGIGLQFAGQVMQPVPDENGYITISKMVGGSEIKYMFFSNPFAVGITLADIMISGTMTASTKKQNYIQSFQSTTPKFDNAKAYFWDYSATSAVTGKTGCWCYKFSDTTTGQVANSEVLNAASINIASGEGMFFNSPTTGKNICIKIKVPAAITALSSND